MRVAPQQLWVHRQGKWLQIMSDEIFPGDVIMLLRDKNKKKQSVPCDLLILSGSAVVNEAILTGESLPLVKESIALLDKVDEQLDTNGAEHRPHLLFSGTEIL
jgi:cation-transporting ATPase 13A1